MSRLWCGLVAIALCVGVPATASANLIVNGGFETGTFFGWTQGGNLGFTGVSGVFGGIPPPEGMFQAFMGPVGSQGTLTQVIPTSPGTPYDFEFLLHHFGGTTNNFFALVDGVPLLSLVNSGGFSYTPFSFTFTATGAATTIQFRFRQDPTFWLLDDVSVVAVPEPTTLVLCGLMGAGLVGYRLRRRAVAA